MYFSPGLVEGLGQLCRLSLDKDEFGSGLFSSAPLLKLRGRRAQAIHGAFTPAGCRALSKAICVHLCLLLYGLGVYIKTSASAAHTPTWRGCSWANTSEVFLQLPRLAKTECPFQMKNSDHHQDWKMSSRLSCAPSWHRETYIKKIGRLLKSIN